MLMKHDYGCRRWCLRCIFRSRRAYDSECDMYAYPRIHMMCPIWRQMLLLFWDMSSFVWPMSLVMNSIGGLQTWASLPSTCLGTSKEQCANTESGCAIRAHCRESASDCDSSTLLEDYLLLNFFEICYVNLHVTNFEMELWIVSVVWVKSKASSHLRCLGTIEQCTKHMLKMCKVESALDRPRQLNFVGGFSICKQRPGNSRRANKKAEFSQSCCQQFERRPWACKYRVRLLILSWHVFGSLKIYQGFISTSKIRRVLGFMWHS